ncbi:MAG: hypothetical protein HBSAPP03_25060 [Phycisphaerae bacterium]|nr:MAG: hypothetical protein HBSAPP03_25060 [Phycisphaerae bacterium]
MLLWLARISVSAPLREMFTFPRTTVAPSGPAIAGLHTAATNAPESAAVHPPTRPRP